LDLLESGLMDNAHQMGGRLMAGLRQLQARHPVIGDVRGAGRFVGIELVEDRKTKAPANSLAHELEQRAFKRDCFCFNAARASSAWRRPWSSTKSTWTPPFGSSTSASPNKPGDHAGTQPGS